MEKQHFLLDIRCVLFYNNFTCAVPIIPQDEQSLTSLLTQISHQRPLFKPNLPRLYWCCLTFQLVSVDSNQ